VKECCHDIYRSAVWIGKDVAGNIKDHFELKCGLEG
jgi:hypothetical protein